MKLLSKRAVGIKAPLIRDVEFLQGMSVAQNFDTV
jgi:hypothetical protein